MNIVGIPWDYPGNIMGMLIAGILFGSNIALLYYNIYPVQLILGSNGAFLMGLLLGVMVLLVGMRELSLQTFVAPIIVLVIPILNTLWILFQSLLKKQSVINETGIHISNVLTNKIFSLKQTVAFFWSAGIISGITPIWVLNILA